MRQITVSIFLFFVVASFFSCKKNRNSTPKKICYGSFIAVKPLSLLSGVLTKIDDNGLPEILSEFPSVRAYQRSYPPYGTMNRYTCYNKNDSCLYCVPGNDMSGEIFIYKCNLATKQTEKLICINPNSIDNVPNSWDLLYNSFANELYLFYTYIGLSGYVSGKLKLTITGSTFSADLLYVPGISPNPNLNRPYRIDEQTGDMYFHSFSDNRFLIYSPITGDTATKLNISYSVSSFGNVYNPNDGKLYGYIWGKPQKPQLVRSDPKTGASQAYGFSDANTDSITGTTFDVCNNQYIFCKTWNNVLNIYWVDVASGKIAKQVTTQGDFYSLIHIPTSQ